MRPGRSRFAVLVLLLLGFAFYSVPASAQSFCDFAPRMTLSGAGRAAVNVAAFVVVTVEDPNGDAIASLTANTSGLPAGNNAVFTTNVSNTSGTLTWTPQAGQTGSFPVSFTASNALSATATATINVIDTAGAPFVQCPGFLTTGEFRPISFQVAAGDPDGEPIVSLTAAPIPTGATFSVNATNTAGTFDWTPNFTQAGVFNISFIATSSTSATYNTAITVTQADRAPLVSAPPSASGTVGNLLTICISAGDPDGDALTSMTAAPLPAGATFTASASSAVGTFAWTPGAGQEGSYTVVFTASNALSGSASVPITIGTGGDAPPIVAAPAAQTVSAGNLLQFIITASDANGDPITSLVAPSLPPGATFLPNSSNTAGTFSWTPTPDQAGTWFVRFEATSNNLTASATTAINVTGANQPATLFTTGGNGIIRLGSGKATWCAHVEPVGGDFAVGDVIPSSIVLVSPGTGSVSEIPALPGKGIVSGDADRNTIEDFEVCFAKTDLRQLFSSIPRGSTYPIKIRGDLTNGNGFEGSMFIDVSVGGGKAVALLPNPPNPGASIHFTTSAVGSVRARVFDIRGRLVRTVDGGALEAGDHALRFDGLGDAGKPLPAGIYLFRVETADGELTTKAAILR